MNILNLFDKYYTIMMLILGLILFFHDYRYFKGLGDIKTAVKARLTALCVVIISVTLFILRSIYY